MGTLYMFSAISVVLLLFVVIQTIIAISPRDDEDIYPKTSFADNGGGGGNIHVIVDNIHINKSENDEKKIFQSAKITDSKKSPTFEEKLASDPLLLYTRSLRQRSINKDNKMTKTKTSESVELDKRSDPSSSEQSSTHSRRNTICQWSEHCDGNRCTKKNRCFEDPSCINGQCASPQTSWIRTVQRKSWQTPWQPVQLPPIQNSCPWGENCEEVSCTTANDCSDNLICNNGRCTDPGQPSNMNPIIYTKVGPQTSTNTNPITNTNTDSLPDTNTNPLTNTNMDTNTLPDINTNINKETNAKSGAAPSQSTNVGGDGGNGVIVINVYGGSGGRGGSAASKTPQ